MASGEVCTTGACVIIHLVLTHTSVMTWHGLALINIWIKKTKNKKNIKHKLHSWARRTFRDLISGTGLYWLYIEILRLEDVLQVHGYTEQVSSIKSNPVLCRNKASQYFQGQHFNSHRVSQPGLYFINKLCFGESNLLSEAITSPQNVMSRTEL